MPTQQCLAVLLACCLLSAPALTQPSRDDAGGAGGHLSAPALANPNEAGAGRVRVHYLWIHFPKAGTSFQFALFAALCFRIPPKPGARLAPSNTSVCIRQAICLTASEYLAVPGHQRAKPSPWWRAPGLSQLAGSGIEHRRIGQRGNHVNNVLHGESCGGLVAIFREPKQRLASQYAYLNAHGRGCCNGDWEWDKLEPRKVAMLARLPQFGGQMSMAQFSHARGMAGCQVKMILGFACVDKRALRPVQIREAAQRARHDFAFAGLAERWSASVCLWYAITKPDHEAKDFTAALVDFSKAFANQRPTDVTAKRATSYNTTGMAVDLADEAVYSAACELYEAERARHGWSLALSPQQQAYSLRDGHTL
ncbi:hypothetical protein T492DRAFT_843563 [Pavlovales sp. CCMP2436]|nr:hypothetical protein T492DRAFT_843563 [Pavlovales sp. CCMP2436]